MKYGQPCFVTGSVANPLAQKVLQRNFIIFFGKELYHVANK